jgi:UDP-N-acetylmuramyl-tripeptide synthetase
MTKDLEQLTALLANCEVRGNKNAVIKNIEHDSRKVTDGTLFVCLTGVHADGHDFIEMAAKKGASAVLVEKDVSVPDGVARVLVPDVKAAMQKLVPFFYDYPSRSMRVIGITGTNGKTTTSYLVRAILRKQGYKVGVIGTINILIEDKVLPIHNTTPDVVDLQRTLYEMKTAGMDYVVMEVSSHALAMNRVAGLEFDTAVFTNLTQDHLDYHKTMENYGAAKAKLFASLDEGGAKQPKTAVVNKDDAAGEKMAAATSAAVIGYAIKNPAELKAENVLVLASGARFTVKGAFGELPLNLKITGDFNVYNVLAAVGAAMAEKISPLVIKSALEEFTSVAGRFELVDEGQDFSVIVDYAHTPDGLENILHTARQIAEKRIITVFGCGGDRDRTKRPIMGKIAAKLSDVVIATSDNPRSENPEFILSEVEVGVKEGLSEGKQHEKITDRREAIHRAIALAEKGDIVIIAGKGHEDYQILKDRTIHFDDKEEARAAIREVR